MRYRHGTGDDILAGAPHTPGEAARTTGKAKSPISRDIRSRRISATRNDDGPMTIDGVELHQVHPLTSRSNGLGDGVATLRSNNKRPDSKPAAPGFEQREIELLRTVMAEKDSWAAELQADTEDLRRRLDERAADRSAHEGRIADRCLGPVRGMLATAMSATDKSPSLVMNTVSWRKIAKEAVNASSDLANVTRLGTRTERRRPALRVVEGGRAQLIADIESLGEELRELEQRLANARGEAYRLLARLRER